MLNRIYVTLSICILFLVHNTVLCQCNLRTNQGTSYHVGKCSGLTFQSSIGGLVSAYGNCGDLIYSPPLIDGKSPTAIAPVITIDQVTVFPNPNTGSFVMSFPSPDNYRITIYDITGKVVKKYRVNNTTRLSMTLEQAHEGLYTIKLQDSNHHISFYKIIINN